MGLRTCWNSKSHLQNVEISPRSVRQDLYFKIMLSSLTYGLIWVGSCCNSDLFHSLVRLHNRAARLQFIIYSKTCHLSYNGRNDTNDAETFLVGIFQKINMGCIP